MSEKKPYKPPELTRFGAVRDLTAGGTGTMSEFIGLNMMGQPRCRTSLMMTQDVNCLP